ncbi:hypothetical protein [Kitasatospora sp. GP82]|uniref:hypothetical protein n=1 Tax=Kitasatospora sp. GP82 TaxID=3035089 RepID=UPI0024748365|nr:hypothetical protein [Kitasatospora sp. GP82]MDH6126253.1 hypothetical protein [Kitasatospora sp. GP82]
MADGHEGGRAGGEWWRVDGPWRVLGQQGAEQQGAEAESVYAPEVPMASPTPPAPPPAVPSVPLEKPGAAAGARSEAEAMDGAWLTAKAAPGRGVSAADFPGWDSVVLDFGAADPAAGPRIPDQRKESAEEEQPGIEGALASDGQPPRSVGLLSGRRPSLLLLVAAIVLLAGAVTGQILVMLIGWAAAYLSAKLGDFTKKFAVFGIPLISMTGSTVWFWGRSQGRWGSPLTPGEQLNHEAWAAAPGVLRLAAVLSALFLLVLNLRRRPQGG